MKFIPIAGFLAGAAALGSVVYVKTQALPDVVTTFHSEGLAELKVGGFNFLDSGDFKVSSIVLRKPSGETYDGDCSGTVATDMAARQVTNTYPWGKVRVTYATDRNRLTMRIETQNTSPDTIQELWYSPMTLRFPHKVAEYDGSIPLMVDSVGSPGILHVSYGSGSLVAAADDAEKPLQLGLPWATDRPTSTVFPLTINTGRVKSLPDSYPMINRPIPPGASDLYVLSLRFGRPSDTTMELAHDVLERYAKEFPATLNWPDRRPIGAIFLASAATEWPKNPRGWLMDQNLDVTTPTGRAQLRHRILELADSSIAILRDMNAQGAITWDIEGQEFAHSISYIGDPRMAAQLAPEMQGIMDDYFRVFRDAGFRVGVCVRPQHLVWTPGRQPKQEAAADPADELINKIAYAKGHWGASLIYIDSNVNSFDSNPLDADVIKRVAAQFPDVLLIPEHSTPRYYAYAAPYKELRQGYVSTDAAINAIYPKAFTLIYTADGPLDFNRKTLSAAVRHGDSLIYRTWFHDPQNEKVKALYKK
jgi:hypothetical protein